jgi:hypothetical protein
MITRTPSTRARAIRAAYLGQARRRAGASRTNVGSSAQGGEEVMVPPARSRLEPEPAGDHNREANAVHRRSCKLPASRTGAPGADDGIERIVSRRRET